MIQDLETKDLLMHFNGKIINNSHYYSLRIFYEDTDAGGIVYHSNYLKFFERSRTALLNLVSTDQKKMLYENKLAFVVRELNLKMIGSFTLNDIIIVKTCLKYAKKSYIRLKQEIYNDNVKKIKNKPKVSAEVQIVLINEKKKVKDITKILNHSFFTNER